MKDPELSEPLAQALARSLAARNFRAALHAIVRLRAFVETAAEHAALSDAHRMATAALESTGLPEA